MSKRTKKPTQKQTPRQIWDKLNAQRHTIVVSGGMMLFIQKLTNDARFRAKVTELLNQS